MKKTILKYRSKDNKLLREHLEFAAKSTSFNKTTYLSPEIQNEINDMCGNMISDDMISACNSAPCFAFTADEATDVATIEQMALCLRFYDVCCLDNEFYVISSIRVFYIHLRHIRPDRKTQIVNCRQNKTLTQTGSEVCKSGKIQEIPGSFAPWPPTRALPWTHWGP